MTVVTMTNEMNTHEQSIKLVERFAQCLLRDSKSPNDVALLKQLAPYITYFNNEIQVSVKEDQIFESFVNMINTASETPDCDSVLQQFHEEIDKAKRELKTNEKCRKYLEFMEMISENDLEEDGEIKTISETVSTIDPISKLPLVEPVKNRRCGHSYEKSTILQLIAKNPRTRCPIAGCSAIDFVKKSDLVPDAILKRMLDAAACNSHKKLKLNE